MPQDPEKIPLKPDLSRLKRSNPAQQEEKQVDIKPYIKFWIEAGEFGGLGLVVYAMGYWQWSFWGVLIAMLVGLMYKQRKEEKRIKVIVLNCSWLKDKSEKLFSSHSRPGFIVMWLFWGRRLR